MNFQPAVRTFTIVAHSNPRRSLIPLRGKCSSAETVGARHQASQPPGCACHPSCFSADMPPFFLSPAAPVFLDETRPERACGSSAGADGTLGPERPPPRWAARLSPSPLGRGAGLASLGRLAFSLRIGPHQPLYSGRGCRTPRSLMLRKPNQALATNSQRLD